MIKSLLSRFPLDTGHNLNVLNTLRRRSERHLKTRYTFDFRLVSKEIGFYTENWYNLNLQWKFQLSYFILKLFQSKMFIVCLHSHSQSRGLCKTQLNIWVLDTLLQTALMQKGDLIIFQTFLTNSLETFFVSSKLITSLQLRNCRGL